MFTLTDKTLLDRAARMINERAKALRQKWEMVGWAGTKEGRIAKLEYDRLLRDERDMRSLGKRLCLHFDVKAAPRQPMEATPFTGVTATEALANLPAMLIAHAPRQDSAEVGDPLNPLAPEVRADLLSSASPGTNLDLSGVKLGEGNPESTPAAEGGTVTTLPAPVGEEVHDG